jgi:hypothetical protein
MGFGLLGGSIPMLLYDVAVLILVMFSSESRSGPYKDRLETFLALVGMGGCALGAFGGAIGLLIGLTVGMFRLFALL